MSAMSPRRNWLPELPRIGMARRSSMAVNCPATRTCTTSSGSAPRRQTPPRSAAAQLGQHLVQVQPQLGQALLRDLDVELFRPARRTARPWPRPARAAVLAHVVGEGLHLGVAETAVGLQRIDHAIHVAELVVEERPLDAARQLESACRPTFLRTWYQTLAPRAGATNP